MSVMSTTANGPNPSKKGDDSISTAGAVKKIDDSKLLDKVSVTAVVSGDEKEGGDDHSRPACIVIDLSQLDKDEKWPALSRIIGGDESNSETSNTKSDEDDKAGKVWGRKDKEEGELDQEEEEEQEEQEQQVFERGNDLIKFDFPACGENSCLAEKVLLLCKAKTLCELRVQAILDHLQQSACTPLTQYQKRLQAIRLRVLADVKKINNRITDQLQAVQQEINARGLTDRRVLIKMPAIWEKDTVRSPTVPEMVVGTYQVLTRAEAANEPADKEPLPLKALVEQVEVEMDHNGKHPSLPPHQTKQLVNIRHLLMNFWPDPEIEMEDMKFRVERMRKRTERQRAQAEKGQQKKQHRHPGHGKKYKKLNMPLDCHQFASAAPPSQTTS